MKQAVFRLAAMMLPFLALLVLELFLRLAGVEEAKRTVFVPVDTDGQYLALNPGYVSRYFGNFTPGVPFTPFASTKPDSGYRVFVLGGSTTAGFPYRFYNGFPGRMDLQLRGALFGRPIEVVNLGMSAVNSFTVLDLGMEALEHRPDVLIVYAGHNEFYGAFGTGSTASSWGNLSWLKRLVIRLRKTVLFSLAEAPFVSAAPTDPDRTLMARMVAETQIPLGSPNYRAALEQYSQNLRRLFEAAADRGVPVIVGTLVSNLSGQPPLSAGADADSAYKRGLRELALGNVESARRAFVLAKDLDGMRFRAPSAINDWLRKSARGYGVLLVDLEDAFRGASLSDVEGSDLFTDHLHPNARGYAIMANAFAEATVETLGIGELAKSNGPPTGSTTGQVDGERRRRGLSVAPDSSLDMLDAAHASLLLKRLLGDFPFNRDAGTESVRANFGAMLDRARDAGGADSIAAAVVEGRVSYQRAQAQLSDRLLAAGDTLVALRSARALAGWQPLNQGLLDRWIRIGLGNPAFDIETDYLSLLSASRWDHVYGLNALGAIRLRSGMLEDAEVVLDRAEEMAPGDPTVLFNKARLLVLQGDTLGARDYFERYRQRQSG